VGDTESRRNSETGTELPQVVDFCEQVVDIGAIPRRGALVRIGGRRRLAAEIEQDGFGHPTEEIAQPSQRAEPDRLIVARLPLPDLLDGFGDNRDDRRLSALERLVPVADLLDLPPAVRAVVVALEQEQDEVVIGAQRGQREGVGSGADVGKVEAVECLHTGAWVRADKGLARESPGRQVQQSRDQATDMTRAAVREGFDRFVSDAIERTAAEFSISTVVGGMDGGALDQFLGDSDVLYETVVEPELAEYRQQTLDQFEVILDWVESDDDIAAYRADLLAAGPFAESIRDDLPAQRRETVEGRLIERHRRLGDAVRGLVASEETDFWAAARVELDREAAAELVEEHFAFTGPLTDHRDAFAMTATIDPEDMLGGLGGVFGGSTFDVDYTDEALRAMRHAERDVIADARAEVDERFES
jgi:hypothetical protein